MSQQQHQVPPPHMSQAEFQQKMLDLLIKLNLSNDERVSGRPQFDQTVMISATTPYQLDYRNRKHVFLYSGVALTLSLEDIGQITVPANIWTDISFQHGMYLYAVGQVPNVAVRIRQTDESLTPGSNGTTPAFNLAQILGQVMSSTNPVITEDHIRAATIAGLAYSYTTGKLTASGAGTVGFQLYNPAGNTKNLLIYSLTIMVAAAQAHDIRKTAVNVNSIVGWAGNDVAASVTNNGANAAASAMTASYSNTLITGGLLGTMREVAGQGAFQTVETLTNGECIWLPAGAGAIAGIAAYVSVNGAITWGVTAEGLEF